jgi:hypothetical protein
VFASKCWGYDVEFRDFRTLKFQVRIKTDVLYFLLWAHEWQWHYGWLYRKRPEVRMEMDRLYLLGGGDGTNGDGNGTTDGHTGSNLKSEWR